MSATIDALVQPLLAQRAAAETVSRQSALTVVEQTQPAYRERFPHLTTNQISFLAAYSVCGSIRKAGRYAALDHARHYVWITDPVYQRAFEQAKADAAEYLEDSARSRAIDGALEAVFYQGQVCGYIWKQSDALLIKLLQANAPEKFKDRVETTPCLMLTYQMDRLLSSANSSRMLRLLALARCHYVRLRWRYCERLEAGYVR